MQGHTIVCGFGQVGYQVVLLLLKLGQKPIILSDDGRAEWVREVELLGAKFVKGDARDASSLNGVCVHTAANLIACVTSDAVNVEIALHAKRLNPKIRVVGRIFDANLARLLEQHGHLDRALAMSREAAPVFAAATEGGGIITEAPFGDQRLLVCRNEHAKARSGVASIGSDGDALIGAESRVKALLDIQSPPEKHSTRVLVHALLRLLDPRTTIRFIISVWSHTTIELRIVFVALHLLVLISVLVFQYGMGLSFADAFYFVIATVTTTGYGDISPKESAVWLKFFCAATMVLGSASLGTMFSIITDYIVTSRLRQLTGRQRVPEEGHTIVVGLGDVGFRTALELYESGHKVVVVDLDPNSANGRSLRKKAAFVAGDARDLDTMSRAGAGKARAIACLTGDDAANLSISLTAKEINPDLKIVLRLFDAHFAEMVNEMSAIDTALSAPKIAATTFVANALFDGVVCAFELGDRPFALTTTQPNGRPFSRLVLNADGSMSSLDSTEEQAEGKALYVCPLSAEP